MNKDLGLVLIGIGLLLIGYFVGYMTKVNPEPDVRVNALLRAPWVEVTVNGKVVDLGKIRLVPEQQDKKKKSGDVGEIGEVVRPAAFEPPIEHAIFVQRDGRNIEAFGIETLTRVLLELKEAIFGNRDKGTPGLRDDIAKGLGDFYGTLRTGAIVAGSVTLALVGWIAVSLHRIADHTTKTA